MIVSKNKLSAQLSAEQKQISDGRLKDESPLDNSELFTELCEACRLGDIRRCMELIGQGANINARDQFDYTPLILASLCGHYEVVRLLLESGALCERDTFQGERCLYNALNDRIRNLLLQYDYSKTTHPLQQFASHINSLIVREQPQTTDIILNHGARALKLHKFILAARSPYFKRKLAAAPETKVYKLPGYIPTQSVEIAIRYLYLGEVPADLGIKGVSSEREEEEEVLLGIDKLSRHLELDGLWEGILEGGDRRLARQRRTDEIEKCRAQLETWFQENVLKHRVIVETSNAKKVQWDRQNSIFADVLLRADEAMDEHEELMQECSVPTHELPGSLKSIPVGPMANQSRSSSRARSSRMSTLFPAHRAMLIRSEYFLAMFSSTFKEARHTETLQIIPIDCTPEVLQVVLAYLYTEEANIPLEIAIDVLLAADLLLLEKLKIKAVAVISTMGNDRKLSNGLVDCASGRDGAHPHDADDQDREMINVYDVIRAGWLTRMPRLEEFGARYLAGKLEDYIEDEDFADLIAESAARLRQRQETDSIELLDDIRFYLSDRFRLRFEDVGLEEMLEEESESVHEAFQPEIAESDRPAAGPEDLSGRPVSRSEALISGGDIRTLDGELAGDEFASEAINYRVLLRKIDALLDKLKLDA